MKRFFTFLFSGILFLNVNAQNKLNADPEKSQLQWLGEKVTGQHEGTIKLKSGSLVWQDNKVRSGEFVIDMTTIKEDKENPRLEGHLRSDDFFGVDKFPEAKFVITESQPFEKGTASVKGELTIKGITNPLEFRAVVQQKDDGLWFYANIPVDRTKYNIRYGSGSFFENLGDKTIYDEFKLKVALLVK